MYPNKEAQLKERFAKSFESIAREMKRANDIALSKADHQQKTQMAVLAMVEPMIKKIVAESTGGTPEKSPKRGKRRGKVISIGERFRNVQRSDT